MCGNDLGELLGLVQFLIEEIYHVNDKLQFEGFHDILKKTFEAACRGYVNIDVADYVLHSFNLQFNAEDKKIQQWIVLERSVELFKYIQELDLNASEMLRYLLTEEDPMWYFSLRRTPEYIKPLYLRLEQSGANVAKIFEDFDIGNTLVAHPSFLLPALSLLGNYY
ncbi:hypothetical protein K7432_006242 [Basidiobolus ranarum]|uniref:Uncharacterized protein n=1 Tax=Basidiobolus ranarum TaxID=34480 RepID=A0ABR2WVA1_9FUNG